MPKLFILLDYINSYFATFKGSGSTLRATAEVISQNPVVSASLTSGSTLSAVGAGIAMIGAIGVGAGQGFAVGRGLEAISRNPEIAKQLQTTLIVGLAIVESSSIYCFIIALILSFR